MRIVVIGLYNSGSTCVAGVLHRLGVDMGAPYWHENECFYEPYDLSCILRHFWPEPDCQSQAHERIRVEVFRNWILGRESLGSSPCGAKHPLFCLSLADLRKAWGEQTVFVWIQREREASIAGLRKRNWFGEMTEPIQNKLWNAVHDFNFENANVLKLQYDAILQDPSREIDRIISTLKLDVKADSRRQAIAWVQPPSGAT
ncbi:hypothetical protein [Novipirellula sp.]|uniref:hypothetical protein n=1 Tax=Novipirellula sp. TaxID=2795430 RepID=UPI00356356F2